MFPVGAIVSVTLGGKECQGVIISVQPHHERVCDYYDGHEISNNLKYIEYGFIHWGKDTLQYNKVRTNVPTERVSKVADPEFIVELDNKNQVKVATIQELTTICKAYQMANLGYKVYGRLS